MKPPEEAEIAGSDSSQRVADSTGSKNLSPVDGGRAHALDYFLYYSISFPLN